MKMTLRGFSPRIMNFLGLDEGKEYPLQKLVEKLQDPGASKKPGEIPSCQILRNQIDRVERSIENPLNEKEVNLLRKVKALLEGLYRRRGEYDRAFAKKIRSNRKNKDIFKFEEEI